VQCRKETCPSTQGCYFLLPNKPPGPVSSDAAVAAKGRPQQQQCCQICKGNFEKKNKRTKSNSAFVACDFNVARIDTHREKKRPRVN